MFHWVLIFWLSHIWITDGCPPETVASYLNPNVCYLFSSTLTPFIIAEGTCRQNGGHLTSIHSAFDNMFLSRKFLLLAYFEPRSCNFLQRKQICIFTELITGLVERMNSSREPGPGWTGPP